KPGADREGLGPLDAAIERPDGDLAGAAAHIDDRERALERRSERARRAQEREPCLFLVGEDLRGHAGRLLYRPDELLAVRGVADGGRRHDPQALDPDLARVADLSRNDLGLLRDLLRRDALVLAQRLAQALRKHEGIPPKKI